MKQLLARVLRVLKKNGYNAFRKRAPRLRSGPGSPEVSNNGLDTMRALIYIGDGAQGAHHIYRQWRQFFDEAGIPFGVLFRAVRSFDLCRAEYPGDLVVYANSPRAIDVVVSAAPELKTVYHTGNPRNVYDILAYRRVKHISIFHGDGEKQANLNPMFRAYDELWVAGQAQIDRLSPHISPLNFRIVGRPQVASLLDSERKNSKAATVAAYLPTWESTSAATNYSSCSLAEGLVRVVQHTNLSVMAKLHPTTGHRLLGLARMEQDLEPVLEGASCICARTGSSIDVMGEADVCITDVSSIVSDWLVTKQPVFVYREGDHGSRAKIPLSDYAYVFATVDEFESLFQRVTIDGDDFKAESRRAASEYLISASATRNNVFVESVVKEAKAGAGSAAA